MEEQLIRQAKKYAKESGKSVSQLVADFFALLTNASEDDKPALSPKVKSLRGLLKDSSIDAAEYRSHLEDKYL